MLGVNDTECIHTGESVCKLSLCWLTLHDPSVVIESCTVTWRSLAAHNTRRLLCRAAVQAASNEDQLQQRLSEAQARVAALLQVRRPPILLMPHLCFTN